MNIISKKKQGVIAIICAIAMVVTSLTIYNPRETKADTDYSTLEFTSVTESMDSTYAYCITENTLKDFGRLYFYGSIHMQVIGSGNSKMKEATVTIDGTVQTDESIAFDRAEAVTGFFVSKLSDNAYHELKIEGEGGNITIILRKGNVGGESGTTEETTTTIEETTTTTEETTINPKDWTTATSEWSATDGGVWHIWAGPGTSVKFKNYDTLNDYYVNITTATGEWQVQTYSIISNLTNDKAYDYKVTIESDKENAYVRIKEDNSNSTLIGKTLVNGTNTLEGSFTAKNGAAKIIMDMGNAANNGATFHVTGVEITEHKTAEQTGNIVEGKNWQVWMQEESWANYVISTDATNYKLENKNIGENWYSIQTGIDGVEFMADTDYVCTFTLKSDKPKEFTFDNRSNDVKVFTESNNVGWQKADDGKYIYKYKGTLSNSTYQMVNIRISLGYHSNKDGKTDENYSAKETATFELSDFQIVKASEYQETTYTVTVDGTPNSVTEGDTYTFGDNAQGYYDATNSVAYASGEEITVNSDITVTSIKLNVAMQKGASVRLATPTGLRFQTVITSENDIAVSDILNKDFVTTGTLITTFDLFSANGNVLDKDSKYTKLDIANSGWYNDEVGKFCGSIIKIKTDNYEKKFVGVGYATIKYHNGETHSIYADVNEEDNARSIYYVANAVKEAGYKNCDDAQKAIIDKYLAKEAF